MSKTIPHLSYSVEYYNYHDIYFYLFQYRPFLVHKLLVTKIESFFGQKIIFLNNY